METERIIQEQLENLPAELRNFLAKGEWSSAVDQISTEGNLTPDQKVGLGKEVMFILIGLELASDFKSNIQSNLHLPEAISSILSTKISEAVFSKVEQYLPKEEEVDEPFISVIPTDPHPVLVPGETAHEVKANDQQPTTANQQQNNVTEALPPTENTKKEGDTGYTPASSPSQYPPGLDPYREPLQ